MRKKRIMIIGPSACGKSTLAKELNDDPGPVKRTQDTIYGKNTLDVPGSYIENTWMYKHIIALSQDASCVLILTDQSRYREVYSPGFAKVFRCPVIGVITKSDITPENAERCRQQLKKIGVEKPYFYLSIKDRTGLLALKEYLGIEGDSR